MAPYQPRNDPNSSRNTAHAGSSASKMWFALDSGTNLAFGSSVARIRPSSTGTTFSRWQWKTSVGTARRGSNERTLMSKQTFMIRAAFSGDVEMRCRSSNHSRCAVAVFSGTYRLVNIEQKAGLCAPQSIRTRVSSACLASMASGRPR
jgi:hypothetical protein